MKKIENIFTSKNFRFILIVLVTSSLLITLVNNLNIDGYIENFIFPILILIISYIFVINKLNLNINREAYYLLIPIIIILFSYFIVDIDYSNKFLNILIIPLLLSMFLLYLTNENYKISKNFISWFFKLFPNKLFSNLEYLHLSFKRKKDKNNKGYNVLIGCLIGIPIAFVILGLLSAADEYFRLFIENIFDFIFRILNIENLIPNIILFAVSFIILFSVFVNILRNRNNEDKKNKVDSVNTSIVSTVLIIINSVFVLFLISEISKITINFLQLPLEYTYSAYAREGFFQLLLVTLINISIIIYFVYYTNVLNTNGLIKKLLLTLVSFSILLILNSYYRMFLYIGVYGFTVLRLQVILFLIMELILFMLIFKKIIKGIKNESMIYIIVVLLTYILNIYVCSEPIVNLINNI